MMVLIMTIQQSMPSLARRANQPLGDHCSTAGSGWRKGREGLDADRSRQKQQKQAEAVTNRPI